MRYFILFSVLVVAPSGSFAAATPPGSVGHHGSVQSGQRRLFDTESVVYCAGCSGGDSAQPLSGSPFLTGSLPTTNNMNSNNRGFAFANNPLIDRIDVENGPSGNQDPAKDQYINMNQDGQYSFGYSAADSARQERRNQDGTVEGSYSYTNPEGRYVAIQYTAGADQGFNAYGDNVPPRQMDYRPIPVEDTPEVKAAREQFLQTYAREVSRINNAKAQEQSQQIQQQPQSPQLPIQPQLNQQSAQQRPKPPIIPIVLPQNLNGNLNDNTKSPTSQINSQSTKPLQDSFDDEDDTEVVYSALANSYNNNKNEENTQKISNQATFYNNNNNLRNNNNAEQLQSSYGFWQKETVTPGAKIPVPNLKQENSNQLPGYFYYVGVGGAPYYVTSSNSLFKSNNFPTSLRATLLGAMPLAPVHDAQVPHSGDKVQQKSTPPVYLDLESNRNNEDVQNKEIPNVNGGIAKPVVHMTSQQTANQQNLPQVQFIGVPIYVL